MTMIGQAGQMGNGRPASSAESHPLVPSGRPDLNRLPLAPQFAGTRGAARQAQPPNGPTVR